MLPSFAFKRLTKFLEQNILESLMSNNLHPRIKNCEHVVCVLVPRVPEKVLMRGLANLWSKSPAIIDTIKVTTPATARRRTTIKAKNEREWCVTESAGRFRPPSGPRTVRVMRSHTPRICTKHSITHSVPLGSKNISQEMSSKQFCPVLSEWVYSTIDSP